MIDVDLFHGAGGAALGLQMAGADPIGFERNADACATSRAAGHHVVRADLATYTFRHLTGRVRLMHGSPPCQPFSAAGDGVGQDDPRDGMPWMLRAITEARPQLVTIENVPGLTHERHVRHLADFVRSIEALGYAVERRVLNAADFGVPQTRHRLIIIARHDGAPIVWPTPTHTEGGGLFTAPWVSMAEALGWGWDDPARTVCGDRSPRWMYEGNTTTGRTVLDRRQTHGGIHTIDAPSPTVSAVPAQWVWERPATTIATDPRVSPPGHHDPAVSGSQQAGAIRVTLDELAALQGFPPGYPFHGNRTSIARQIGNALPPALIAAVIKANLP